MRELTSELLQNARLREAEDILPASHKTPHRTMDSKISMPKLEEANSTHWKIALQANATILSATEHVTGNVPIPSGSTERESYQKHQSALLALIISSVPSEILNQLATPPETTAFNLLTAIEQHLHIGTPQDHKSLRIQPETTIFQVDSTLEDYLRQHKLIRSKMIAASYPGIHDESTTVEFLTDGLKHNPATIDIGRTIMGMNPRTIKDFFNTYNRITAYNTTSMPIVPTPHPLQITSGSRHMPPNFALRATPIPNPCSFHLQFMKRFPPTYTDDQCMDRRHPKFANNPSPYQSWQNKKNCISTTPVNETHETASKYRLQCTPRPDLRAILPINSGGSALSSHICAKPPK